MMGLAAAIALAQQCAPSVAPETLLSVVQVESRFDPLAIGINGANGGSVTSSSRAEAASKAAVLLATGRNIDLGLAQINSRNLAWLGLSLDQAFEPCANLAAAAHILQRNYARSDASRVGDQAALRTTLSLYNTGHPDRGISNGYVGRVSAAASRIVPAVSGRAVDTGPPPALPSQEEPPATWDVFGETARGHAGFVISISTASGAQP